MTFLCIALRNGTVARRQPYRNWRPPNSPSKPDKELPPPPRLENYRGLLVLRTQNNTEESGSTTQDTSTSDNTCAVLPTSHRLQSMVISTTTGKWSDNEVNPTNAPTSERFSQTRLILAALQAHHNKNSEFVQNSDAKLPTSNSTMIIICTMSTPLSSIRFFLSAQVLLIQERSCRTRLHCCKQKLTFHWSNNHAMVSRGRAATEKLYFYPTRHAKGWEEQSGQEDGSSANLSLNCVLPTSQFEATP